MVGVGLLAGDYGAVRECDVDRRDLLASVERIGESSPKVKELRPFSGIFGAGDLLIGLIHQGVSTIPKQPALCDFGGVEFFSHHGFDRIAP